jgi:methyl-accepting chemotaxis protein
MAMWRYAMTSIRTKLLAWILPLIFISLGAYFTVSRISINGAMTELAYHDATELAERYAAKLESTLIPTVTIAKTEGKAFESLRNSGITDRKAGTGLLTSWLRDNDFIYGLWVVFEPNAWDGRDKAFANREGFDSSGRFRPYVFREGTKIAYTTCDDSDTGDYYQNIKKNPTVQLLEPYLDTVNSKTGEQVLMTSVGVPIKDEAGNFIGAAGCDITLSTFKDLVSDFSL